MTATSPNNDRVQNRTTSPWSAKVPAIAAGVALLAWALILASLLITGLERNRIAAALGLLLFRKRVPPSTPPPPPVESKPATPVGPPRLLHLPNAPLESIPAVLPLWRLFDKMNRTGRTDYPVVDEAGHLIGVIALADLPPYAARDVLGWLVAADVMRAPRSAA
jgi:CBS domain-containing protein